MDKPYNSVLANIKNRLPSTPPGSLAARELQNLKGAQIKKSILSEDQEILRGVIVDVTDKMMRVFLNWARPNRGLFVDEFRIFGLTFTTIDHAWRIADNISAATLFLSVNCLLGRDIQKAHAL